jgi:hypothetical protein
LLGAFRRAPPPGLSAKLGTSRGKAQEGMIQEEEEEEVHSSPMSLKP